MVKIKWLFSRLKAMSFLEVIYRIRKYFNKIINKIKYNNNTIVYSLENIEIDLLSVNNNLKIIFKKDNKFDLDNNFIYYSLGKEYNVEEKILWHEGTINSWDSSVFSGDIEFKNTDNIGDIRCSWEINRHQFMPYLAAKYIETNNEMYFDILSNHFYRWAEENSFCKGINWSSSMEIALRAYQWMIIVWLLKDTNKQQFLIDICKSIIFSIKYVMKNLSLYSSANNHLILEASISSIIGYVFKDIYKQKWFEDGYRILEKELPNQFYSDGVNKEQALHYQAFVTDMMLQYNSIMKNLNKNTIKDDIIRKSIIFIGTITAQNNYVDFGDSDDAKIITLDYNYKNYYDYILAFAEQYYNEDFGAIKKQYKEISLFIKNYNKKNIYINDKFSLFKYGGYALINDGRTNVLFDFGDLGFGNIAAHGHSDGLMLNFIYNGKPFFVDAGTYIYNIQEKKRNYYRSTIMHNTLCYDSKNQSKIAGPFLWTKKAKCELLDSYEDKEKIFIKAMHNGYSPYNHIREVSYYKDNDLKLVIKDYFDKPAIISFILDEKVDINKININEIELINCNEIIHIKVDGEIKVDNITVSREFTKERPSKAIRIEYNFKKEHTTIITNKI